MSDGKPTLAGVELTHLDQEMFDGAGVTKGEVVRYLDAVRDHLLPHVQDRLLTVVRVHSGGGEPFMQKDLPKHAPSWVPFTRVWAATPKRYVRYALCNDRRTLVWFGNQRAVEYHPGLSRGDRIDRPTHVILDLNPPSTDHFDLTIRTALAVREALSAVDLAGSVKTSGAKGVHVFVPIERRYSFERAGEAGRALAERVAALEPSVATTAFAKADRGGKVFVDSTRMGGAATVVAAYSPRVRPGVPVSFPLRWDQLERVHPEDFTITTVHDRLARDGDGWTAEAPPPQRLPAAILDEGKAIPIPRIQAMHAALRQRRAKG